MITLTEHLILELNSSTLKNATKKAERYNDSRAKKFFDAYLSKAAEELDNKIKEGDGKKEELYNWAKEDLEAFYKIDKMHQKNEYKVGRIYKNGFTFMYPTYESDIRNNKKSAFFPVYTIFLNPIWIAVDKDKNDVKKAFLRNDKNHRIVPISFYLHSYSTEDVAIMYATYDIDDDKIIMERNENQKKYNFSSDDDLNIKEYDNIKDFLNIDDSDQLRNYVNWFLKEINKNHKDI